MARLTRAQQQERTRAAVLVAARAEFAQHGYVEARVDRIAELAELTRGAVYSNFPSKQALYLAVLLDKVERADVDQAPSASPTTPALALSAFARGWLDRLPLTSDTPGDGHLRLRSLSGVGPSRTALAGLVGLEALLLALPIEELTGGRQVRLAELVLTMLAGAGHLAETAPGFGDPFDVVRACEHLGRIHLGDTWDPPHLPYVTPAEPARDAWAPPADMLDQVTARPVDLARDGVVAVLGASRLGSAEDVVRAAAPGDQVTVVVVTGDPAELGRLVRLRIGDLTGCLRRVFTSASLSRLRVVVDDAGAIASALGLPDDDATEAAVRVEDGLLVARATGPGAGYAAANHRASGAER